LGRKWCPHCGAYADELKTWEKFREAYENAGGKYDFEETPVTINCIRCGKKICIYMEIQYHPRMYVVPIKSVCGLNSAVVCYRGNHFCVCAKEFGAFLSHECEHYQPLTEQEDFC
jgi:hypothetical protein